MAYWPEDKIAEWELEWFGKKLTIEEYNWIANNEPGYFLLLLHLWNTNKWDKDRTKVGEDKTFDGLLSKLRTRGFNKPKKNLADEIEEQSLKEYKESIEAIKKLEEMEW